MKQPTSRRRKVGATLLLVAVLAVIPAGSASAMIDRGQTYRYVPHRMCAIDWRRGTWYVKKLIRCAASHFSVPGGADKALYIANRESRYEPRAYNRVSCAKGIYQHLCRYWPERADDFGFTGWSAFNARANVIVTMRMVRRYGWSPWGG